MIGVTSPAVTVAVVTPGCGAEYHDAPMAPQTRNQVVFDWLDQTL